MLIEIPDATVDDLMKVIPGPDFPTRGFIYGRTGIRDAYTTGGHHHATGQGSQRKPSGAASAIIVTSSRIRSTRRR